MENRGNPLPSFLQQCKKRPDSLNFDIKVPTMVSPSPQSPWSTRNTRSGFITPLGEYGQILSPVTTPGGSLKRKMEFQDFGVPSRVVQPTGKINQSKKGKIDASPKDLDEWPAVEATSNSDCDYFNVISEMLGENKATSNENSDEEMENDGNEMFGILPGPSNGPSNNWGSPMSVSSPVSSTFFGLSGSRPGTPTGGIIRVRRGRTPAATPTSTMCDKAIFGFPSFPDSGFRVEETWD